MLNTKKLKLLRKETGLTQKMIAQILQISCSTYTKYELGYRMPDLETLTKLSKIFQVSVDYLLDMENTFVSTDTDYLRLQKIISQYSDAGLLVGENGLTEKGWNRLEKAVKIDVKIKEIYDNE